MKSQETESIFISSVCFRVECIFKCVLQTLLNNLVNNTAISQECFEGIIHAMYFVLVAAHVSINLQKSMQTNFFTI